MQIPDEILKKLDLTNDEIEKRKGEFKEFVRNNSVDNIIDKYLLFGTPFIFRNDENKYYELQREIEEHFGVARANVHIVGSSKLGFSISPMKLYKDWNDDSDIDIALVDYDLFLRYWKSLYNYNPLQNPRTENEERKYRKFLEYLKRGWLRSDLFPQRMSNEVFDFLKQLYGKYQYKVRVGVYADAFFFQEYNKENISQIKKGLTNGL